MFEATKEMIWVLEDDKGCQLVYEKILGLRFQVRIFEDLASLRHTFRSSRSAMPKILIADLRLPDESFLDFLDSSDSEKLMSIPYLVVSSYDDLDALRYCFEHGAKDYITKPFGKNELIVKIERLLKEQENKEEDITINSSSLTVSRKNHSSEPLTSKEYQLISILVENPLKIRTRKELILGLWNKTRVSTKTLDVHLFNLRKKMEPLDIKILFRHPDSFEVAF